jgi:signal peptidase I
MNVTNAPPSALLWQTPYREVCLTSLLVWAGMLLGVLLILPWAAARAARAVGSTRGRYGVAVRAILIVFAINLAFGFLYSRLNADKDHPVIQAALVLFVAFAIQFTVFLHFFQLSVGRTFAPVGAYLAVNLAAFAIAFFVLRLYVSESFVMPTHSMMPTLDPGDRFFVNKRLGPNRFDLVAYWNTESNREPMRYCKRLIALPGERLRFENGGIFINDRAVQVPVVLSGKCRASVPGIANPRYQDGQTIALGPDEYFFVGDQIDLSADSRIAGPSTRSSIVGVVDLIYWPFARMRIVR